MRAVATLAAIFGLPVALGGVVLIAQALLSAADGNADAAGRHLVDGVRFVAIGGVLCAPLFYVLRHDRD